MPVFVDCLTTSDDEDEAWHAVSAVVSLIAAVAAALSALFVVVAPLVIRLYFAGNQAADAADQRAVATLLLRLFTPQVAIYGLIAVVTAVLHARRRFTAPKFAPVLNNLVVIALLLALPHLVDDLDIGWLRDNTGAVWLLGLGTTAGVAAMAAAMIPAVVRSGARLRWVWEPGHPLVRRMLRLSGWTVGFVALNQIALAVVIILANHRAGDYAVYTSAYIFFLLPHAVVGVTVMDALQTDLSEHWSRSDLRSLASDISRGVRLSLAVLIPAAIGYALLARPIVTLVIQHGALKAASAQLAADTLAIFAFGLPGFTAFLFFTRVFQAMHDTRTVFWLYVGENALNIAAAVVLHDRFGVQGLAFAYAFAYTIAAIVALVVVRRRVVGFESRVLLVSVTRVAAAAAAMGAAVLIVARVTHGLGPFGETAFGVIAGVTVYAVAARALGVDEFVQLLPGRKGT